MGGCCAPGFNGAGGFDPAAFAAAFPSAWWKHVYLNANVENDGQAGMLGEKVYTKSPNNVEWQYGSYDQNEETVQWATWIWCAPFNWKVASGLKLRLYWFLFAEGSLGQTTKWQWHIRSIGDLETVTFDQTYTNNDDVDSANDILYITPRLNYTPLNSGGSSQPDDLWHIMVRRQNDSASGPSRLLGLQIAYEIDPTIAVP